MLVMQDRAEIDRIMAACLSNAEELLNASKVVAQSGSNHIAYHLAALALEEVGKASMIFMSSLRDPTEEEKKRPIDWIDNHERKLFWALWSLRFDSDEPTKGIKQALDIARIIHQTRLAAMYVELGDPDARTRIDAEQVRNLINLAEAQLELQKLKKPRDLSDELKSDMEWFFAASENPQLRAIIFSKESFEKQAEFETEPIQWLRWLKATIEEWERSSQELTRREINRVPPEGEERHQDKWQMKLRLKSWSHSIRPKAFKAWNAVIEKIKFQQTSSHEMLVTLTMPKSVQGLTVWVAGQQASHLLVIALNIGTAGFFWWYLPTFVSKYAESVFDLEENAKVDIERVPQLKLDWGNLVLTPEDLHRASLVFAHMGMLKEERKRSVYMGYFRGLALLAKNDIFVQFEPSILIQFTTVIREAMSAYGDWDGEDKTFEEAIDKVFQPTEDGAEFMASMKDAMQLALITMRGENKTQPITLDSVIRAKLACDIYLRLKAEQHVQDQIEQKKKTSSKEALFTGGNAAP